MNTPAGHERLFNLTCALLTTKRGLTKQEIFSTVQGYKEQLDKGVNKFALERQFERDKATLKDSGIYFITENPYYAMEDNQEIRYRIPPDDFTWAAGVSLSPRQLALLQLAAKAWANASMSEAASQGLIRLKALGETLDDHDLIGLAPRLVSFEPALYRLTEAVEKARVVSFSYRKAGSEVVERRTVEPWALFQMSDQWLLVSWDQDRQAVRNFLLKRIIGAVSVMDTGFEKPSIKQIDSALYELEALQQHQIAKFRVRAGSAAAWHFDVSGELDEEVEVHYFDLEVLAEQLREFLGDIEILSPESLRNTIRAGLERVVNAHHG